MLKTKKIILVLIFLNLIAYGFCFYLFTEIKNIERAASESGTKIEFNIKKNTSLRSVKNIMNDTKKEREQLSRLFIQPDGTIDFIETVESFGKIAGVKIEIESVNIEFLKNKKASSTEKFKISLKTEGEWSNTIHFLSILETAPYQISFDDIKLDKISTESIPDSKEEKGASYWRGGFVFGVLKMKNLEEDVIKAN